MSDGRTKRSLNLSTAAARAGADADPGIAPPLVPAIDQTTVHSYRSLADLDRVFDREAAGPVYYAYAQDSVPPLPASLEEAIRVFADSPFTRETFGPEVVSHLANFAAKELETSQTAVTDFDRRRLFDQRSRSMATTDVQIDPVAFLRDIERAWQARDGEAAAAGYSDGAVLIYGNDQRRTGEELRRWSQQWFHYATDLHIQKTLRSFSGDCLGSEWQSVYTHPETGKRIHDRGAEFFWIRDDGKVYKHTMFEHTWTDGENAADPWPAL